MIEVVQVGEGHDIDQSLDVNSLVPFNLLVGVVVDKCIRHMISNWCLDLFKDVRGKALFVSGQERF